MTTNQKISAGLVAGFALLVAVGLLFTDSGEAPAAVADAQVVRDNSHRLSAPATSEATLVEFLDFECEACGAAFPVVEDLRERYGDQVTFVARYFPLPGHANSMNAALAVEAAAQQGAYEAMYRRMFETQAQWGEQQQSQAPLFRGFAEELGLDMAAYDRAVADPATRARVEQDKQDGEALGVTGTPTFFLDGELLEPTSVEGFEAAIEAAIDG